TERYAGDRSRPRRPRGDAPKAEALVATLEALYRASLDRIAALIPLAETEDRAPSTAVRWLRQRSAPELAGPLRDRVADRTLSVPRLWAVLALDDFDDAAGGGGGSVANSYRAV